MQINKSLAPKSLLLGITGGIAAYKAAELVRLLVKSGIDVQVVMTAAACQFITPVTMQALSGKPVFIDMWDSSFSNGMPHIELSRNADAILVAPASADFMAKLVQGRADDLLSTLCLARDCPLLVAPAMNKQMWENPATQRNITQLKADGIIIFGPDSGEQACGEIGLGRMLEAEDLQYLIEAHLQPKLLKGKKILITAGATLEMIDPVRAITNLSSGKMGYSIARAAFEMGADVTLVSGATTLKPPIGVNTIQALSADAMYQNVMQQAAVLNLGPQDVFISVAAVADYSPLKTSTQKIKKSESSLTLALKPNKDILADLASLPNAPFCVGFAAETENLLEYAEAKRQKKKLPLIVANLTTEAMGSDNNSVTLLDNQGAHTFPSSPKLSIARLLLAHIASLQAT
ncbi:MAG: bifunctional phosphopantothenoylcysteine decarboxylase/phosphopantothenate--cysteine ligase CoaBC [Methylotenera sp.]|nr:bifunctional phosphopantothenoylcysteine decarboxylase/phosphopantothenate--cysteine ligase CoaBC [Methylotenera sp.]